MAIQKRSRRLALAAALLAGSSSAHAVLKNRAASWKDYFFEEAHVQPGS
jgi:hypothetical protein